MAIKVLHWGWGANSKFTVRVNAAALRNGSRAGIMHKGGVL
jgi:hypothetical protein